MPKSTLDSANTSTETQARRHCAVMLRESGTYRSIGERLNANANKAARTRSGLKASTTTKTESCSWGQQFHWRLTSGWTHSFTAGNPLSLQARTASGVLPTNRVTTTAMIPSTAQPAVLGSREPRSTIPSTESPTVLSRPQGSGSLVFSRSGYYRPNAILID